MTKQVNNYSQGGAVEQFKVKILKKFFFSEETGFTVCKVSLQGKRDNTVLVGTMPGVAEGDFLEVEGERVTHPRFGQQIKVATFKAMLPQDREGIVSYLSSRIKGIGKRSAEKIADRFGREVFDILEKNPERLREIKGIKKSIVADIRKSTADNVVLRELTVKLAPFGIGHETIYKIFKAFGNESFDVLENNPYLLIERIKGVGFKIADTIARRFDIDADHDHRVRAGIDFLLSQYEQKEGHLYIEEGLLISRSATLLDISRENTEAAVQRMVDMGELMREHIDDGVPLLVSPRNYNIEKTIAVNLFHLSRGAALDPPKAVDFDEIFKRGRVQLTDEQKRAVTGAVTDRITVITGGPGTGKTTIIRAIIAALKEDEREVLLAAPTGRAAKRIEEATHYSASTIHRMLKINPENGRFLHNESNPLKADAVIVDEFSMVDVFIFHSLLKAISQHTRLIIIGDKDQLPSVGPGNVLRDIIGCGYFNIIYLNRNFRQTANSLIIENAYRINTGEDLIFKPYSEDLDFVFIRVESERQALEKVLRIIEYYKDDYPFNCPDFQVLAPMYRGDAGIDNINRRIQEKFNDGPLCVSRERFDFKQRDKVMQLKNNYEKDIFNGEQGTIARYKEEEKSLGVDYDGQVKDYGPEELEELALSYVVSVHKAQGSEYEMLVLVLLPSHSIMLNRELFYTAVTRARKRIFLVSDPDTVKRAVFNASPSERKTLLRQRMKEVFEGDTLMGG